MTSEDDQNDAVLAALSQLRGCDVDQLRAHRLRVRCRAAIVAERRAADATAAVDSGVWRRIVAPALLGAWCAIYVVEVVRRAAAIHGL